MIYFFDGTESGFLTAFLQAFGDESALLSCQKTQLLLGQEPVFVQTDEQKAAKAKARLCQFDNRAMRDLCFLLRSGEDGSEQAAFLYLKRLAKEKQPVRDMLTYDDVFDAVQRIKRVGLEIHRFHGFIRFMESANGALYAPFSPDHDICDLLTPHFKARLGGIPFILHDVARKKAAVCNGAQVVVVPLEQANLLLSENEQAWQTLWKEYYKAVNIPSRERLKQMLGYMPARYHAFMPERQ